MPCPLDGCRQLPLVLITITGSPSGNDFSLFSQKTDQSFFISEVDKNITGLAEAAYSFLSL
jgi:hypothetical protein